MAVSARAGWAARHLPRRDRWARSVPSTPLSPSSHIFVGRGPALAVLDAAVLDAAGGRPRFVLVEGQPGVGKTALIDRFLDDKPANRIVRVIGAEAEGRLPYAVASDLLRQLGDRDPLALQDDVMVAGGRLLAALGDRDVTTIVVIDDAQWIDAPSLNALVFAIRRLEVDPVAIIACTRRHNETADVLARVAASRGGAQVVLEGLLVDEIIALGEAAAHPLSVASARRLREHTDGLPLHVIALLDELGPAALRRANVLPAPRSYATVILGRVAEATPDTEAFIAAAAVLGPRSSVADVAVVAGIDDPLPALDAAVRLGLVDHRRLRAGDEVEFVHALVRAAILDAISPARRSRLHRRAAEVVAETEALEHRAAAAVVADPGLATELQRLATDEVARGAIELGAHHLLESARLTADPAAARTSRLDALEALVWGGALVAAQDLAKELQDDLGHGDDPRSLYLRGFLALLAGQWTTCEDLLLAAWDRCDPSRDGPLQALIAARLAQLFNIFVRTSRGADALAWAERAYELTPVVPGRPRSPSAILLVSLVLAGRPDEARRRALPERDTGAALADGRFDEVLGRGIARLWTDDLDGARADLTAAGEATVGHAPYMQTRLWSLGFLAITEYRSGRWDDSALNAELAVSLATDADHLWLLGFLHSVASFVPAARGQWDAAAAHVDAARAVTRVVNNTMGAAFLGGAAARLDAARGDAAGVVAATDALAAMDPSRGAHEPGAFDWIPLRISALASLGRLDEASSLADFADAIALDRGRRSAIVAAARARGTLEAARGRDDLARRAFERAEGELARMAMPFTAASLRLAYGGFLRRKGERRAAAEQLTQALATFDVLGARPFAERAKTEAAALGLHPRRRDVMSTTLTPREHGVAQLVAEGLTNREIAERLVVSVKTVEYHLGNAFTKLGVRSRAQLVAKIARAAQN